MSRVYQALTKAAKDRAKADIRLTEPLQSFNTAVSQPAEIPPAPESAESSKPWRERLEKYLRWDLRRLEADKLVAVEQGSEAAEQFRILCEQIGSLYDESTITSISVTSPLKQDGKTLVAVNLALAMSQGGNEPVILIDADLDNSDVHKYFGVQRSPGLTDYLLARSDAKISSYARATTFERLTVIPSGRSRDGAAELLTRERIKDVVEQVEIAFPNHQVIIDSPPVLQTSNPLVLPPELGGLIMVVRASKTRREYLRKAMEVLNSSKLIGIVLNGADSGAGAKYYSAKAG